jgi:hypothetical protein
MGIVFLSGTLVGAVGHMLYSTKTVSAKAARPKLSHEDARKRYVTEMETRLTLSSDQKQQLIGILDEFRAMYKDTHARIEPEMKRIQEAQRNKIRGMLSDTQRAEYEKLLEEKDRKRRSGDRPPGGGI